MRGLFTIAGLLVALAIVAVLARKQVAPPAVPPMAPGATDVAPAAKTPKQVEDDFRRALEAAQQQRAPIPEDAR